MAGALTEVLPLGLAVAVSPFAIIPVILLLFTPRALVTSAAFLGGWVLGLAGAAVAFAFLASVIELAEETPTWAAWGRIVLGVALLVLGVRQWLARRKPRSAPAWMTKLQTATPGSAFGFALLLALANPKILLLSAAAGLVVGSAELSRADAALAILGFTLVASLSVAVPVVLYAVLGERILVPLGRARDWLERNNAAVMAIVILVIGVSLVVKGGQGL